MRPRLRRQYEKAVTDARTKHGLLTRLASHASGRLSGNQFCVYVANRLVIPSLVPDQLIKFGQAHCGWTA